MDLEVAAYVNSLVVLHRGALGFEHIERETSVHSTEEQRPYDCVYEVEVRHDTLKEHGQANLETDINEPKWLVVVMWSFHELRECLGLMLGQIGIGNQNDETSVKELGHEQRSHHPTLLLGERVVANAPDEEHHSVSEYDVHAYNNERN